MYRMWELEVCSIRKDILLHFSMKNQMNNSKNIQYMTNNCMLWLLCVIGVIISFQKSLFYILIMKLSSMLTLKRSLTIIMGNESPSYKNTPFLFDINLLLRTRQLTLLVECIFFLLWLYRLWDLIC